MGNNVNFTVKITDTEGAQQLVQHLLDGKRKAKSFVIQKVLVSEV